MKKIPIISTKFNSDTKKQVSVFKVSEVKKFFIAYMLIRYVGIDQIPAKFLKDVAYVLTYSLPNIIILTLKLSVSPQECKIYQGKSLFRKGAKTDPKNHRRFSLLALVSRIIEKSIHYQQQYYLKENDLLYKYQSGFRAIFLPIYVWLNFDGLSEGV